MDDVARLPRNDRLDLFTASAGRRGISPIVVEKDLAHTAFRGGLSRSVEMA